MGSNLSLAGMMSVLTGVVLLVAFFGAFPLCMGPSKEYEEEMMKLDE